jgi:hypothetical protein
MSEAEIERQGGCACGQVGFRVRGEPLRIGLCHCLTCRKVSGSAFNLFAVFPAEAVTIEGEMSAWSATSDGPRRFCPACGSQLFHQGQPGGPEIEIKVGAFDAPNLFAPTYEAFVPRRETWLGDLGLKRYPGNRTGMGLRE